MQSDCYCEWWGRLRPSGDRDGRRHCRLRRCATGQSYRNTAGGAIACELTVQV
jgi:hypothetical protein